MAREFSAARRTFFGRLAVLGGTAVLLAAGQSRAPEPSPPEPATRPRAPGRGYRLTEHVARYYETARG